MKCLMRGMCVITALFAYVGVARADTPIAAALANYKGTVVIARGDTIAWTTPTPRTPCPQAQSDIVLCHPRNPAEVEWPWASVTKQVVATLVMQQVEAGLLSLDVPATRYLRRWPGSAPVPTVRQLIQHRAGLRNPNDSVADAAGKPSFYSDGPNGPDWCLTERKLPGGDWRYNNCDYIVLGEILKRATGRDVAALFAERIARPLGLKQARFVARGAPTPSLVSGNVSELIAYGAAGAFVGTPNELLAFDRALLSGKLLKPATLVELWRGDPALGFMALGQWSFSAPLKGCSTPVRVIERRGGIGATQVRNILLPDLAMTIIMFLRDENFDFGEIWQGKGLSHDVLVAAACR